MTRPGPAPLLAALAGSPLAGECLVLRSRDGLVVGFTTLDEAQMVDLSDDDGPADVTCDGGMTLSALTLAAGFDASFGEVSGPLGPVLTREAVDGGRWDDAEAWLFTVSPGIAGYAPLLGGKVREARTEDPRFVLEIRSHSDALNQQLTQEINPYCPYRFGAGRCPAVPIEVACLVTAVTDAMRFAVSYSGDHATGFFKFGEVHFSGDDLDGVASENIVGWTQSAPGAGTLLLWEPLPATPEIGQALTLRQGCYDLASNTSKSRAACMALLGSAIDFGGEPDLPGRDLLLYPDGSA